MSLCYMCPYPFFSGARARRQNSAKLNRPGFGCLSERGGFAQRWKSALQGSRALPVRQGSSRRAPLIPIPSPTAEFHKLFIC